MNNNFIEEQRKRVDEYKKEQEIAQLKEQISNLSAKVFNLQIANMTLMKAIREMAAINIKLCDKMDAHNVPVDDHAITPADTKMLKDMGIKYE